MIEFLHLIFNVQIIEKKNNINWLQKQKGNSGMSVTDGKNKLIIVIILSFLIKFIIDSNTCICTMFPKMEEKNVLCITQGERETPLMILHIKNGIWLLIVTDTCYSCNISGDKQWIKSGNRL